MLSVLLKYAPMFLIDGDKLAIAEVVPNSDCTKLELLFKRCGMIKKKGEWYYFKTSPAISLAEFVAWGSGDVSVSEKQLNLFGEMSC